MLDLMSASLLVLAILGWFVDKAFGSVIGEYTKRIWSKRIEPIIASVFSRIFRRKNALSAAVRNGDENSSANLEAITKINKLLERIDALETANIRLKIELGAAYAKQCKNDAA